MIYSDIQCGVSSNNLVVPDTILACVSITKSSAKNKYPSIVYRYISISAKVAVRNIDSILRVTLRMTLCSISSRKMISNNYINSIHEPHPSHTPNHTPYQQAVVELMS